MIAEAVDTAFTLGWALLAWIALSAVAVMLALYAVIVTAWATVRGAWRAGAWLYARHAAPDGSEAPPVLHEAPVPPQAHAARHAPAWAQTDKEAA